MIEAGRFQEYDYGSEELNMDAYSEPTPPEIILERIKQLQQKRKSDKEKEGDGEGKGKKSGAGTDPKGPKKFEDQGLSNEAKQKVFDHISEEERETLKRLAEDKNKNSNNRTLKPW